jgi:putative transposase
MSNSSYRRHRFPAALIQQAVWLYFRFPLSLRDVEDMLSQRGIDVSYETGPTNLLQSSVDSWP